MERPGTWYTTLLNAHGNPIKDYGEFEMARKKLPQTRAGERFMA